VNYDILESDFNKKFSSAYQLSILVGMDNLVFFVFDAVSNNSLLLKAVSYANRPGETIQTGHELQSIFAREELFGHLFRRVRISLPAGPSVLVPSRLYNETEKETYLTELVSANGTNGSIQHDEINEIGAHLVYYNDPGLVKILKKQFPTAHVVHPATPFLLGARRMVQEGSEHSMFVHFTKKEIFVALFEKKNLLFFNAYSYSTAGDVLYFTLLTLDQFSLDPATTPLSLSGQILEDAEIYRMLARYLGQLQFIPDASFLKFGRRFKEVQPYFFFDLYSLSLCK